MISRLHFLFALIIFSLYFVSSVLKDSIVKTRQITLSQPPERYLVYVQNGGFSNQIRGTLKALWMGKYLNRTVLLPPISSSHVDSNWYKSSPPSNENFFDAFIDSRHLKDRVFQYNDWFDYAIPLNETKVGTLDISMVELKNCWRNRTKSKDNFLLLPLAYEQEAIQKQYLCIGIADNHYVNRYTFKEAFYFSRRIRILTAQFKNKYLLNQKYVAVHIRRGDFKDYCQYRRKDSRFNFKACWPTWEEIFAKVKGFSKKGYMIFVSTNEESEERINQMRQKSWVFLKEFLIELNLRDIELHMTEIILSQSVASEADTFIGTGGSSFTDMINEMRKGNNNLLWN